MSVWNGISLAILSYLCMWIPGFITLSDEACVIGVCNGLCSLCNAIHTLRQFLNTRFSISQLHIFHLVFTIPCVLHNTNCLLPNHLLFFFKNMVTTSDDIKMILKQNNTFIEQNHILKNKKETYRFSFIN